MATPQRGALKATGRSGGGSRRPQRSNADAPQSEAAAQGTGGEPDVLLDVPKLSVDEIGLEVDNLQARIALQARLADLVQLHVGADVAIERVALEIKGVEAQAQLKARLDNVLAIVQRALETVDQHPELLTELARTAGDAAGQLGESAGQLTEGVGLLGEGAGRLGQGAAEATGSAPGRRRRRSGGDGSGSEPGSADREAGSQSRG